VFDRTEESMRLLFPWVEHEIRDGTAGKVYIHRIQECLSPRHLRQIL